MKRFVLMLFSVAALSARPCGSGLSVPTDSVISFSYDARNMTILLDGREVPYYFVFDTISGNRKPDYVQVGGSVDKKESIKKYGEKYRMGILIYQTRDDNENARNE